MTEQSRLPTNLEIARAFCENSFQRTFGLSDERTEVYAGIIAELLDYAVANARQKSEQPIV